MMPPANTALIAAMRDGLARQADPAKASGMRAYMKSNMPFLGVQTPDLRRVVRAVLAAYPLTSAEEWRETVLTLWREAAHREERYAAIALAGDRRYRGYQTLDALPLYEEMIVSGAWWDLVDGLASHEIGGLLRRYPQPLRQTMLAWSRDADLWKRRTSILCQLSFKDATDETLLYGCLEFNLADRDFFIRRAIGWALREYAKTNPDAVREFIRAHDAALSPLSRREATKHLSLPDTPMSPAGAERATGRGAAK